MESVDFMDKYLDPPALPDKLVCEKCGGVFDAELLNDDWLCEDCAFQEALEQEQE